jgi:hypothetical protein
MKWEQPLDLKIATNVINSLAVEAEVARIVTVIATVGVSLKI